MQDRLGRQIKIGNLVSISNHPELDIKVNWIVMGFVSYELGVEAILRNFIDGSVIYVSVLDLEKEFD